MGNTVSPSPTFKTSLEACPFGNRTTTDPPLVFESTALEAYYSGSLEIPGKFFKDFQNVPWEENTGREGGSRVLEVVPG